MVRGPAESWKWVIEKSQFEKFFDSVAIMMYRKNAAESTNTMVLEKGLNLEWTEYNWVIVPYLSLFKTFLPTGQPSRL